jgi:hypothetical protein
MGCSYFYGWDSTVGHSGQTSIKSLIGAKIQAVEMTEETFKPRVPNEIAKTGKFSDCYY